MVGFEDVVGDGAEPLGVVALGQIDSDNPFETVSGGAAEEEPGVELSVAFEGLEEFLQVWDVVEVETEEAAVLDELVFFAGAEGAGEGAVVEVLCFEFARFLDVADEAECFRAVACVVARDVIVGVPQGDVLVGYGVAYRRLVEGEAGDRCEWIVARRQHLTSSLS